ncbi:hypothetical protein [Limosilactobacillus reuteri]|uniref:Uncharacterized protein n=1 Tax=Limosilactobacillus reuteri TaxID=1598 RepID=A0A256SVB2_LIMRT|nr:hypothetical protein [Limosilactobacillus reuteri]OYS70519.1 hypothetical protein CBF96_02160 [Limosilactobacillus reuteri]
MNEYTRTRLLRIRDILARHVNAIDMALDFQATDLEIAQELSLLLNQTDKGSYFKQDCKEVEAEAYRLADEEGLIHE